MKKSFKVLLIFMAFLFAMINCKASTTTFNRDELKNYGVNKKWKITDKNRYNVLNTKAVDASEKIYDFSNILNDSEEQKLKLKIDEFIKETKMDMVIVTDEFDYSYDEKNEEYAADFYDYNDFGIDFKNYSGVLLLRNTNPLDKYYNIYTFGEAQLYFSYERLENTLDSILLDFKSTSAIYEDDIFSENNTLENYGTYYKGMLKFIEDMKTYYKNGIPNNMKNYKVDNNGYLQEMYRVPWLFATIFSIIITAVVMVILINKNKMVVKATDANNYYVKDSLEIINKIDSFIRTYTTSYRISSSDNGRSSSSGGGSSSDIGSSGGGHSSGGGRHG